MLRTPVARTIHVGTGYPFMCSDRSRQGSVGSQRLNSQPAGAFLGQFLLARLSILLFRSVPFERNASANANMANHALACLLPPACCLSAHQKSVLTGLTPTKAATLSVGCECFLAVTSLTPEEQNISVSLKPAYFEIK